MSSPELHEDRPTLEIGQALHPEAVHHRGVERVLRTAADLHGLLGHGRGRHRHRRGCDQGKSHAWVPLWGASGWHGPALEAGIIAPTTPAVGPTIGVEARRAGSNVHRFVIRAYPP